MSSPLPYNDYGGVMRQRFGGRVQKLAVDAHLSCPNRDGSIATGGCTFCRNDAFSPAYCREADSITTQLDRALHFHHSRGRNADHYLAYFQSGTNTHAPVSTLESIYREALSHSAISGIIIGTRPDCINSETLQLLAQIAQHYYVAVEYGIESVYDATLRHTNRGHDFATAVAAVAATKARNIDVGAHFILGLPNESRTDIIKGIHHINALDLDFIKFHQLQIYHATPLATEWELHPERFLFNDDFGTKQYVDLIVEIVRHLHPSTAIERFVSQAPTHLVAHSPLGGIRPDVVRTEVIDAMQSHGFSQGDLYIR